MKRFVYAVFTLLAVMVWLGSVAQTKPYTVVFYNLENLFDTIKSPGVFDEEFTPQGPKAWNGAKYRKKIENIEQVFYNMAGSFKSYPTIIGVSEIENRNVLEDVVATPKLMRANYQIAHYDSPDARGVDVALLYRPDQFNYEGSRPIRMNMPDDPGFKTRDILSVWGTIEGERFCFFVCHWPSRLGGQAASEPKRCAAAAVVKHAVDSILAEQPDTRIVIMGDLNDDPTNKSIFGVLGAKGKMADVKAGELFNPFLEMFKAGYGTLAYQDGWNLFDNIIVSENLLNGADSGLKLIKPDKNKYYGNIFDRSFLRQTSGQYKNYPLRTFVGNTFQGGYSDHFPVYIQFAK